MSYNHPELLTLFRNRWPLIVLVFVAFVGLSGLIYLVAPRKYEAQMKLLVKNERAALVVTPAESTNADRSDVNEARVNSEIELLRSRDILRTVVEDAKLYEPYLTNGTVPTQHAVDEALEKFQKDLSVAPMRKSDIIQVVYRTRDSELAKAVVLDLEQKYLNAHLAIHSMPGTYKFFRDETQRTKADWEQAQSALTTFHSNKQIFSLSQQSQALIAQFEQQKGAYKDLSVQIKEEEARLISSRLQLARLPQRLPTQRKLSPNQFEIQQLKTIYTELTNQRAALVTKYKPKDRQVVELDRQIENTRKSLQDAENNKFAEESSDVNPAFSDLQQDIVKHTVYLDSLRGRQLQLASVVQEYVSAMTQLDHQAAALRTLEENEKRTQDNFLLSSRRLEEARLAESLDQQKIGNVAVIEQPTSSSIAVFPKLAATLGFGSFIGLFFAIGLAYILELREPNLSTAAASSRRPASSILGVTASGD